MEPEDPGQNMDLSVEDAVKLDALFQVLEPYPEARAAFVAGLKELGFSMDIYEEHALGFEAMKQGRKRSIPERVWGDALRLYSDGHGYRAVASRLAGLGVFTTRGSVERLVKGLPPYVSRRTSV